ncbi:MAG TPA: hypothetical protein VG328_06090 [Stellaceae bacterium]|nr:hypothetical protein [Stellaceae bacterium]
MKRRVGLLALCMSLAGCGSGPPLPTYQSAFTNLYNAGDPASVPADAAVRVEHPVAIILSDNVEAYIDWLRRSDEAMHKVIPAALINTVGEADADPNYIAAHFLDMLKQHFPEAQVVKDFNAAVGSSKKAVLLLDIQAVVSGTSGGKTTVDATLYVFDAQMNPVSKMSGHGEGTVPFPATTAMVQPSTDAAVRQLDAKVAALAH